MSTRLGEVAFYEVAFLAGLCFLFHPTTLRGILGFHNICPTQLAHNAWRSMIGILVLRQSKSFALSLDKFQNLFSLFKNPNPD